MRINKIVDSSIQSLYSSLQQVATICQRNFDAWVRQNIIDEDPYDHYEQELLVQRILWEAENPPLNLEKQNNPIQNQPNNHEVPIDLQNSLLWLSASHIPGLYPDLKEMSRQC